MGIFGHTKLQCTENQHCSTCGRDDHEKANCPGDSEPICLNCEGKHGHGPTDWNCPVRKQARDRKNRVLEEKRNANKESIYEAIGLGPTPAWNNLQDFPNIKKHKDQQQITGEHNKTLCQSR